MAKMKVKDFADKFQTFVGDSSLETPEKFVMTALNWAFNELPRVPKLNKIFSRHYTLNLDAEGHYKWNLNQDFRRLSDIPMLKFWTSDGGKPCPLTVCPKDTITFYERNGLPEMREPGKPCEYTIEQEDDNIYLVMDRPLDIPAIVDYIAYGYPKPVASYEDEIEISAIAENLILGLMRTVMTYESSDYNWGQDTLEYLSNYAIVQAIQELNKNWRNEAPIILGES